MSDSIREQCRLITQNHNQIFLRKKNVVGMGYGYKITNGINTSELCFKVFVAKKEGSSNLNDNDLIPKIYQGIRTDVIQTGKFKHSSLTQKELPLKFGYSIGPYGVRVAGTAGCLVVDQQGAYHILSNNHVLADTNKLPVGTPILHPGTLDGGKYPDDLIAITSKIIPLKESTDEGDLEPNLVDCAIAKVTNSCLVTKKIALIGNVRGICEAKLNMKVKKTGRSTEFTTGIITTLDASFIVEGDDGKLQLYEKQIITTKMDEMGDSGSLLLDRCNNAIGLLSSGSDSDTTFSSIQEVLKALNVKIVTC